MSAPRTGDCPTTAVPLLSDLPVYCWPQPGWAMLYAPGCLAVAADGAVRRLRDLLLHSGDRALQEQGLHTVAAALRQAAARAVAAAGEHATQEYRPLCLTLYLTQACRLACTYCYADAGPATAPLRLAPREIAAAATLVAANCAAAGRPLTVVFHGGGEPTTNEPLLWQALAIVRRVAHEAGCGLFTYIATGGCIGADLADRLAAGFDLVGLSCDGPPAVQNRQRPLANGGPTAAMVERTAGVLRRAGRPFHVRSTITAETAARQAEVADYVATVLQPAEMHFEPVYRGGRQALGATAPGGSTTDEAAGVFVRAYLEALDLSERLGTPLRFSGVRLGEVHGPFCQVSRQVLNLVPGAQGCAVTACFKQSTADLAIAAGVATGGASGDSGLSVDAQRAMALNRTLSTTPTRCESCFNRFHCAGECPDHCRLAPPLPEPGFRCLVQQRLAFSLLHRQAETLRATHAQILKRDGACLAPRLA